MKVLFATSEAVPFVASGGLAEVSGALPRALRNNRIACRVIMPLYSDINPELRASLKYITNFQVPLSWRNQYCGLFEGNANGVKYYFLDNEYYFKREGLYGFYDDAERFAFFSKAVVEAIQHLDFIPDILHCNDWQTALAPVYLDLYYRQNPSYISIKTIFTIHNIQYQGKYGMEILETVVGIGLEHAELLQMDDCVNFVKGAVESADRVTTVSPTYANELLDPWFAHGLDRLLVRRKFKLSGILNGIDTKSYDPATDPALWKNYSVDKLEGRAANRTQLLESLDLPEYEDAMVVAMVTRLVAHKGLDLVKYVFEEMLSHGIQFIILGTGEHVYEDFFRYMQEKYPDRVRIISGFIPELARRIYGGADAFLMPSKTEPCGLAQMISARYGALPIVRETGGLYDTIRDAGQEDGNGFTFKTYNAHDMLGAIDRARGIFNNKEQWKALQINAMSADFSWGRSAKEYIKLYQSILPEEEV